MPSLDQMLNGDGFRFYRYDPGDGSAPVDLLSVTSIRTLCGEGFGLVNWKLANLADAVLGTQKRTVIGPRGGVSDQRQVFEFPSEFARQYAATDGNQGKLDQLRSWLREQAEEPRNIAAMRGSIVHGAIEGNHAWDRIERPYVEAAFDGLSSRDRKRIKRSVTDEDVAFVRNAVRQYWALREAVPMVILAREVRVLNLTAGYAGTFDALVWVLPKGDQVRYPGADEVTVATVAQLGGYIALLDWKTAKDVHTDNVVQAHAYLSAEFAIVDGVKDQRLTALLEAAQSGGIAHIRPDGYGLYLFDYSEEVVGAFLGSLMFARLLARYPKPDSIFRATIAGKSEETDADE
jgi:hypothetical protein